MHLLYALKFRLCKYFWPVSVYQGCRGHGDPHAYGNGNQISPIDIPIGKFQYFLLLRGTKCRGQTYNNRFVVVVWATRYNKMGAYYIIYSRPPFCYKLVISATLSRLLHDVWPKQQPQSGFSMFVSALRVNIEIFQYGSPQKSCGNGNRNSTPTATLV